ncbi:TPA: hypothetical protein ACH3X2_004768 [Trebouxia sp. C0005]
MHAVSLFCRAALNIGDFILPKPVLQCIGAGSLHTCMKSKFSQVLLQRYNACCEPVLQSSTEQWGMHFAQTSAALHVCWLTAHLYEFMNSGDCICQNQCHTAFVLGHCKTV